MLTNDIYKPYVRSEKTDVMATLRRMGWLPPSECQLTQDKWAIFRNLQTINEENLK